MSCASPPVPTIHLAPDAWRADLEVVRTELPRRHANAFHRVSREVFDGALQRLEARLDELDDDAKFVELARIVDLIGDGHTYVRHPRDRAYLPVELREFGDEIRIAAVMPGHEAALGARLVKVGDAPVADAMQRALEITSQGELMPLRRSVALLWLARGDMLHGMGLVASRARVTYTLADDDGRERALELAAVPLLDPARWVRPYARPPLSGQRAGEPFWCASLASQRAVYCNFRSYEDLGRHAIAMVRLVRATAPERLVIDLRDNGGGDYEVGERSVIHAVRRLPINRKGRLFVLIGTQTFSAAMNNAAQFRTMTAATLIGEPIGEKPNSYQEVREMTLPNSHLIVRYSTRWYAFVDSGPNIIEPDVRIAPSWADYAAGRDPVLAYALDGTR